VNEEKFKRHTRNILIVIMFLAMATIFSLWLRELKWPEATIILTYLLSVFFTSRLTEGFVYGVIASLGSVILFNFFFTEPLYTLRVNTPDYFYTFGIMLIVSIITGTLTQKVTLETKLADEREARIKMLIDVSREFFQAMNLDQAISSLQSRLSHILKTEIFIVTYSLKEKQMVVYPTTKLNRQFQKAVDDCLRESQHLSIAINQDISLRHHFFPVRSKTGPTGVIIIPQIDLNEAEKELIEACCAQLALAQDRQRWIEKQQESMLEIEQERMRVQLLSAISHDLRTPLSSIIGSVQTIVENYDSINKDIILDLLGNVSSDSQWLLETVENILSMMRIQDGTIGFDFQQHIVEEIVEEVLSIFSNVKTHPIKIDIPSEALFVHADSKLIIKVLINLIQNAIKYTPESTPILLSVKKQKNLVVFEVADFGPGLNDSEKLRIFDRFYSFKTKNQRTRQGLGLGLSICKSIVEAHGGTIRVLDNKPTGCRFVFTLKIKGE
jgi:two-component system, OmpR family, sensor histidine kinase KdpD